MSQVIFNGQTIDLSVNPGESIAIASIKGTFTASIVRGTDAGTVLATNSAGSATYGPYASGAVVRISASASGSTAFDIGQSPVADITDVDFDNGLSVTGPLSTTGNITANGAISATGALTTAGLKEDSSGNLGIGETSPSSQLTIKQSAPGALGPNIILNNSGGGFNDQTALNFQSAGVTRGQILSNVDGGQGGSGSMQFWTLSNNGATFNEKMRIDASGNLGLGVTPSASWRSGAKALQVGGTGSLSLTEQANGSVNVSFNAIETGGNTFSYGISSFASRYNQIGGNHSWFTAPSGTAGNPITFTQAMTLDASGNLSLASGSMTIGSFTTATRPAHASGKMIYVSDGGAGAVFQGSNGSSWVNLG